MAGTSVLMHSLAEVAHAWHSLNLLQAFGGEMSHEEVEVLFKEGGQDSSGRVGVDSLANLLQQLQLQGNLFKIIKRLNTCSLPWLPVNPHLHCKVKLSRMKTCVGSRVRINNCII